MCQAKVGNSYSVSCGPGVSYCSSSAGWVCHHCLCPALVVGANVRAEGKMFFVHTFEHIPPLREFMCRRICSRNVLVHLDAPAPAQTPCLGKWGTAVMLILAAGQPQRVDLNWCTEVQAPSECLAVCCYVRATSRAWKSTSWERTPESVPEKS
jgi:hypothetical protein